MKQCSIFAQPFDIPSNFPLEILLLPYFLFLVRVVYRVFEFTHQDIEFKIHFIFLIQTFGTMKAITGSKQKNEQNKQKKKIDEHQDEDTSYLASKYYG